MAILTTSGRTALARSVAAQPLHLAWGSGDPAWDTVPVAEDPDAEALEAELGRRPVSELRFVVEDEAGAVETPEGKFSVLPNGQYSNNLYVKFNFDYDDAPTASIREVAVFVGTQKKATVPSGKFYLEPTDIDDFGTLLAIQHRPRIIRSGDTRQSFELVLTL